MAGDESIEETPDSEAITLDVEDGVIGLGDEVEPE